MRDPLVSSPEEAEVCDIHMSLQPAGWSVEILDTSGRSFEMATSTSCILKAWRIAFAGWQGQELTPTMLYPSSGGANGHV